MATLMQAQTALGYTKAFFQGGLKSSNKQYDGSVGLYAEKNMRAILGNTASISMEEARARVDARNTNQALASPLTSADALGNKTPVQFGRDRVNSNQTYGNCGAMACVGMHFATAGGTPDGGAPLAVTDVWLVRVENPSTTYPWYKINSPHKGKQMSFGHSWAQLGTTQGGGAFIVDPWAQIACAKADFPAALKAKLNRWHSQNKRISVSWGAGDNAVGFWMNANDDCILSLLNTSTRTIIATRGDGANAAGPPD